MLNDGNFGCKCWFSPALGAFIMGSIIAETTQAEHIEHLVKPVKDLFAAVFLSGWYAYRS
jgi:CPA2 family monovalent cation:H+ antiporter-2